MFQISSFPISRARSSSPPGIISNVKGPGRRGAAVTTWWTSDEHYGHHAIIRFSGRPFGDVDEMRDELVRRHNERVSAGDEVWHLGDFAMNRANVASLLRRLNGRHVLVAGNHDACHPCHRHHEAMKLYYLRAGFRDVFQSIRLSWGQTSVLVTHMPPVAPEWANDVRYPEWRPDVRDVDVVLHGHVHEKWRVRTFEVHARDPRLEDGMLPRRVPLINVGVDVWNFTPVASEDLVELVSTVR